MPTTMANTAVAAAMMFCAAGAAACDGSMTPTAPSTIALSAAKETAATDVASDVPSIDSDVTQIEGAQNGGMPLVAKSLHGFGEWAALPCCQTPVFKGGFLGPPPAPTVVIVISQGANQVTNGGTIVVRLSEGSAAVRFGFSTLRSNINEASCSHLWMVDGNVVSTAAAGLCRFTKPGAHAISVKVTNALNVSTTTRATVAVF